MIPLFTGQDYEVCMVPSEKGTFLLKIMIPEGAHDDKEEAKKFFEVAEVHCMTLQEAQMFTMNLAVSSEMILGRMNSMKDFMAFQEVYGDATERLMGDSLTDNQKKSLLARQQQEQMMMQQQGAPGGSSRVIIPAQRNPLRR